MTIHHSFVSAKAEQSDSSLVGPTEWNASHVIDNNTLTYAMIQQVAANRVLGNSTGITANVTELTASNILDMVSNTNGALLTRTGGTWGTITNWTTDSGDLTAANNAGATQPATASTSKIFSQATGGRNMFQCWPSNSPAYTIQPHIGRKRRIEWIPRVGNATIDTLGCFATGAVGTLTARSKTTTNLFTSSARVGYVSAAGAGSVAGTFDNAANHVWLGNGAGFGGWHFVIRFGIADASLVATGRTFVGLMPSNTPTDVDPSTLTNLIGVGNNNGDTVMQLYAAGGVAQTRTSFGANFPANTVSTDWYELILFAVPNASTINFQLTRLNTGNVTTGSISGGSSLPSSTTLLTPMIWRSNGGTASAVAIDLGGMYLETET